MCDYSLVGVPNRLAVEGEQLVSCLFSTGSMGLTSGDGSLWRSWFRQTPAVCVPPGARLLLRDIPKDLRRQLDVQAIEEVTFVQLSAEAYQYRDAVRFKNGREVLLQRLKHGQRVEVLDLCSDDTRGADHQRREEEYRRIFVGSGLRSLPSADQRQGTMVPGSRSRRAYFVR
jgi:hypothetical protein